MNFYVLLTLIIFISVKMINAWTISSLLVKVCYLKVSSISILIGYFIQSGLITLILIISYFLNMTVRNLGLLIVLYQALLGVLWVINVPFNIFKKISIQQSGLTWSLSLTLILTGISLLYVLVWNNTISVNDNVDLMSNGSDKSVSESISTLKNKNLLWSNVFYLSLTKYLPYNSVNHLLTHSSNVQIIESSLLFALIGIYYLNSYITYKEKMVVSSMFIGINTSIILVNMIDVNVSWFVIYSALMLTITYRKLINNPLTYFGISVLSSISTYHYDQYAILLIIMVCISCQLYFLITKSEGILINWSLMIYTLVINASIFWFIHFQTFVVWISLSVVFVVSIFTIIGYYWWWKYTNNKRLVNKTNKDNYSFKGLIFFTTVSILLWLWSISFLSSSSILSELKKLFDYQQTKQGIITSVLIVYLVCFISQIGWMWMKRNRVNTIHKTNLWSMMIVANPLICCVGLFFLTKIFNHIYFGNLYLFAFIYFFIIQNLIHVDYSYKSSILTNKLQLYDLRENSTIKR